MRKALRSALRVRRVAQPGTQKTTRWPNLNTRQSAPVVVTSPSLTSHRGHLTKPGAACARLQEAPVKRDDSSEKSSAEQKMMSEAPMAERDKAVKILAKSIFRELKMNGYETRQIVALSSELLGLV